MIGGRLLPWMTAISVGFLLLTLSPKQAWAEFEIQETQVEKGEVEVDYRGAVHWGFSQAERKAAAADEGRGALEEEEGEFLRQSHDIEPQFGITDRWMFSITLGADEPLDDDFDFSGVEGELQYEVIEREGDGFGLALIGAYGFATRGGEADEIEFAPFVEWASGPVLLTVNPIFTSQVGDHRETDGLGFEYGWRVEYTVARRWSAGVEMFGEIEDLSRAGSFDSQKHSLGPTLFYYPAGREDESDGTGGDDDEKIAGAPKMEFSMNVGVQFGLTDLTSDGAMKFQGTLAF